MGHHVSPLHVDLLGHRQPRRPSGPDALRLERAEGLDTQDAGALAGRGEDDLVAGPQAALGDPSSDDSAVVAEAVEAVDILDRQAERQVLGLRCLSETVHRLEHRGAFVPKGALGPRDDVVPVHGADGDERRREDVELCEKGAVLVADLRERLGAEAHAIHLADDDDDLPNPEQAEQVAVAPAVLADALGGVDEQDGRLSSCRTRDHVLQELDVPRRVDDEVVPRFPREETPRRVDRDALRLLGLQSVEQKRQLEGLALLVAEVSDLYDLRRIDRVGVREEPSDEGRLAVIDVADNHDVHLLTHACPHM